MQKRSVVEGGRVGEEGACTFSDWRSVGGHGACGFLRSSERSGMLVMMLVARPGDRAWLRGEEELTPAVFAVEYRVRRVLRTGGSRHAGGAAGDAV
ncbi:hypothetical protein E2562_036928 [Oryza meyeriana var. granulata]|uniref:Uncharacterized protein n=1 Tax=Oryza meyeriana var. granulata TaxID=110450 RepID=A0A6G1FG93_9ORYZ|nr:hypothetical protein E2562_036928 [Oryza meyeriana var. granulata]